MKYMGKLAFTAAILTAVCSTSVLAADSQEVWVGKFYNISPNKPGITTEYCLSHSLDTYTSVQGSTMQEVTAENGVKATKIKRIIKPLQDSQIPGAHIHIGEAVFTGVYQGKPWQTKAYYYALALQEHGYRQGIWADEDCKGFFTFGPKSEHK